MSAHFNQKATFTLLIVGTNYPYNFIGINGSICSLKPTLLHEKKNIYQLALKRDSKINNNKLFFALKKQRLMQQVLINTLMIRNNCLIDDLAKILNVNEKKLHRVWQGSDILTEKKSTELIRLFYIL